MTSRNRQRPTTVDEFTEWNTSNLQRLQVSRRSLLKGLAAGAGGIMAMQFTRAQSAFAAAGGRAGTAGLVVAGRHLSFISGAHGTIEPGMALTAQIASRTGTLPANLYAYVDLGTEAGRYGSSIEGEIVHLLGQYAIPGGPVGSQFYAKFSMPHLHHSTMYHYRVRLSDGTVTGDASFMTAPPAGASPAKPFTFTAFADVGTNVAPTDPKYAWHKDPSAVTGAGGTWPKGVFDNTYYSSTDPVAGTNGTDSQPAVTMTDLMSSQRPVFTLLAGDICYADPSGSGLPADDTEALSFDSPYGKDEYDPYVWDVFLSQIESQAAFTPWMFATGNHDMEALYSDTKFIGGSPTHGYASHAARLDLPSNGPSTCPSVYSFIYGNVGVISVDANDLSYEIQTNTGYSKGAQVTWLEQTLSDWRSSGKYAKIVDFVVVFFHHCAYSTTSQHASDGGVRDALDPLFSKYQVDLVVQGHNHVLERTDPIKYGKKTVSAPDGSTISPATDGVTYICVGSGGRPRYEFQPAPSSSAPPPHGVKPHGPQALPEGQRYRGYQPPGGKNKTENNSEVVDNSYVWSNANTTVNQYGYPEGTTVPEAIDWSQVRYDDYAFIAVDVAPAAAGRVTTFTVRVLADALPHTNEAYTEIDRITMQRVAGRNALLITEKTHSPRKKPASLPAS